MDHGYLLSDFLIHQKLWAEEFSRKEFVGLPDGTILTLGGSRSGDAVALRVHAMMASTGIAGDRVSHACKVFHLSWIFWVHHEQRLLDSGWIILNDGENAVLKSQLVMALHRLFNVVPVPHPESVSIEDVIAEAEMIAK